ncbi:C4-type zinc ribbon domain-containing protein [uncultured Desulfuromonas sp.]|uniref:zinc ribbon domain-containing protein n=1 Tax=uncultured Desulfuromonas sp. TaxID=181013 RepID=UPI002AAB5892|nr:C4-type zinc ribbon domain-containing protein [uncultured Desulfuromonas sp.]
MKEEVQLLIDLQELDQHIISGRKKQEKLREEQKELTVNTDKLTALIAQLDGEIATIEAERSEINQSLLKEQDNIEKSEAHLPEIKTQKEYLAMLKEVDVAKKQTKDLQEILQDRDAALATIKEDRDEKQQELDNLQSTSNSRCSEINDLLTEIDESLVSEDTKRAALIEQVPARIRQRYELLLKRRNGSALVEARRGNCLGCNMHLPPQFFNNMLKKQGIDSCPHCNRLLYVMPEGE